MPEANILKAAVKTIPKRYSPEGGFVMYQGESFSPEATAWAVMALASCGGDRYLANTACQRLAKSQLPDGRIPVIESHPESFWPTSLALFAWKKVAGFERQAESAIRFLLKTTGKHWPKSKDSAMAHDTAIKGWPWIEGTHSWIEPTAMAALALRLYGFKGHERVKEAVKMILDRQLPSGGWNYGNTAVFNKELRPAPEYTGMALTALSGLAAKDKIRLGLDYLSNAVLKLRTPLSLAWSIFGVSAWSNQPAGLHEWILESLNLQKKYGAYNTVLLSQLLVAYFTNGDLIGFLAPQSRIA